MLEPSRDFLQIPPHLMSADTILEWPIFQEKYPREALIGGLFQPRENTEPSAGESSNVAPVDDFIRFRGLLALDDERIPSIIDRFLQNIHTKNPILDVESLVKHGRKCAEHGVGWDGLSCLVLLACALGSIARPFDTAIAQQTALPQANLEKESPSVRSLDIHAQELHQGESYFALACRRLGLLKPTMIGAQCHFFAGVFLTYTLRPVLAWQYFFHASTLLQLHLKTTYGIGEGHTGLLKEPSGILSAEHRKIKRLEQSLYWSCFKSECEFRVELPFPQSELSLGDYPNLFPSPPSPEATNEGEATTSLPVFADSSGHSDRVLAPLDTFNSYSDTPDSHGPKQQAKHLYNEEESWYYYLTEIALRRIGNRIINSFFCRDRSTWIKIKPFIRIAQEFEVQVSSWSAHLPPAMQHFETTSVIRAPHLNSQSGNKGNHVSRELSWAVDNRLLEMQTWLYQPFLYYVVHVGVSLLPPELNHRSYYQQTATDQYVPNGQYDSFPNSFPSTESPRTNSDNIGFPSTQPSVGSASSIDKEDLAFLRSMVVSGIECNLKTLDVRSVGHRHHGLWFDLRSIMCASLTLLAVVKSGNAAWIPGGAEVLWGPKPVDMHTRDLPVPIAGKFAKVLEQFEFWASEAPDMSRYRKVLEEIIRDVRGM